MQRIGGRARRISGGRAGESKGEIGDGIEEEGEEAILAENATEAGRFGNSAVGCLARNLRLRAGSAHVGGAVAVRGIFASEREEGRRGRAE